MIHYFGTPCGATRDDVARFLLGRHALIPWSRPEDIGTAAEVCQSFCLDNGAFTAWKQNAPITDWTPYYEFVKRWRRHPAFDWAIIPDVVDGDEKANDVAKTLAAVSPQQLGAAAHEVLRALVGYLPSDLVLALAEKLAIDLAQEWAKLGPRDERRQQLIELHNREQLVALGKELRCKVGMNADSKKSFLVEQLLTQADPDRLPAAVLKAKGR